MDAETAMYENALFNADVANFVGSFTCEVSNARGVDDLTVELNGWFHTLFEVYCIILIIMKVYLLFLTHSMLASQQLLGVSVTL